MLHEDPKIDLQNRRRFLGIIVSETERLTRLINQILDMAKLESGRAEWTTTDVCVGAVVMEAMETLEPLFREKSVRLERDIPTNLPLVQADRDRLTQVLVNLLSNAVKFVPEGAGCVWVTVRADDTAVRVSVADNGPGLTGEECKMIFEKFRQGGDTMTSKPQGTGLGLPISRQIVEYFGGKLWVDSSPGNGATFIFTVPHSVPDA
jgi:signal transduction histidine kinase